MELSVIILAAGQGTRMRSDLPKVLQPLAGRPLLAHVLECAAALDANDIAVVYGHGGDTVKTACDSGGLRWVLQEDQLGTGHAVQQAMPDTPDTNRVLVLFGDVPLLTAATLEPLIAATPPGAVSILGVDLDDPSGYGRIVRSGDDVTGIVEHKDANEQQRQITEINTGVMICPAAKLKRWLGQLGNDIRRSWRNQYEIGHVSESNMANFRFLSEIKCVGRDRIARQGLQRQRGHELLRVFGHDNLDSGCGFDQQANDFRSLEGGNAAAYA